MIRQIKHQFKNFSEAHPALFLAISSLLGALLYFEHIWWAASSWLLLHFIFSRTSFLLHTTATLLFALYCSLLFSSPPKPETGRAIIAIHSIQRHRSPFASGWLYKGTLKAFESVSGRWTSRLPCTIVYRGDEATRPRADSDYLLEGTLRSRDRFSFSFKPTHWQRIEKSYSLAELRISSKERIRSLLHRKIQEKRAADFLGALFMGEIDDRSLSFEFARLGLQHILAISGFHFALLAAFAAAVLRQILSYRFRLWFLLAIALLYFLFIGNSPPVQRSFLAVLLFLSGALLKRRSSGLNLLGACLLFEIAIDPLAILQLGFQFSFLSCAAILLLNAPLSHCLAKLLPKRTLQQTLTLNTYSQIAYICTSFFTRALSLTLAVNLALWPLLLYHFHRFPYLSLLYNLFAPSWAALCLLLLLSALLLHAIFPLLGLPLFKAAGFLAGELLEIVGNPPALLDGGLSLSIPGWFLAPYLGVFFLLAIFFQRKDLSFSPFSSKKDLHFYGGRSSAG